jgi:hypothetical protein
MQNSPFNLTEQRQNTPANKELRKLLQIGNIMSLALSSDKAKQELAMSWPEQVERARMAGAFR